MDLATVLNGRAWRSARECVCWWCRDAAFRTCRVVVASCCPAEASHVPRRGGWQQQRLAHLLIPGGWVGIVRGGGTI